MPFDHSKGINVLDAHRAYDDYKVATRAASFRGLAPDWSDLGCRGCWGIIRGGQPAIDIGTAAFHQECYDLIKAVGERNAKDSNGSARHA